MDDFAKTQIMDDDVPVPYAPPPAARRQPGGPGDSLQAQLIRRAQIRENVRAGAQMLREHEEMQRNLETEHVIATAKKDSFYIGFWCGVVVGMGVGGVIVNWATRFGVTGAIL